MVFSESVQCNRAQLFISHKTSGDSLSCNSTDTAAEIHRTIEDTLMNQQLQHIHLSATIILASVIGCCPCHLHAADAAGGGFLDHGLMGHWFAGTDASGDPVFTRRDVRVDFDWGEHHRPGGATVNGFNALDADAFSVRWRGRLAARFTETYSFHLTTPDAATLRIRAEGEAWQNLIIATAGGSTYVGTAHLQAGIPYDVELDYAEDTGPAAITLEWSGASFRREVIDPAQMMSINIGTYRRATWADGFARGRNRWEGCEIDELGNPTGDGQYIFWEILSPYELNPLLDGMMRLSFTGSAEVGVSGACDLISSTYDAKQNQTVAMLRGKTGTNANVASFTLKNTSRSGTPEGPGGVTDLKLTLPEAPGSDTPMNDNMLFHPVILEAFSRLTGLRFQRVNDQAVDWSDRTHPSFPYQGAGRRLPYRYNDRYNDGQWNLHGSSCWAHEVEIMLCNITGNDYYVTVPHLASMAYYKQLALLIKHGSDASGIPYEQAVANPVHPPLNSNLRVYVELSNELWNFAQLGTYAPFFDLQQEVLDLQATNHPDFDLLNHDGLLEQRGKNDQGQWHNLFAVSMRWWGLRTIRISEQFRAVFGDDAMPGTSHSPRVRPLYGWQYNNTNGTCTQVLGFLEDILGDPQHAETPAAPNHHIYAGGGAGYYGAGNKFGLIPGVPAGGDFEQPITTEATTGGSMGDISFVGTAGVAGKGYRNMPEPQPLKKGISNHQAAYLGEQGAALQFEFTAPMDQESNIYGVVYRAVLPEGSEVHGRSLSVQADGEEVAVLTGRGTQPLPWSTHTLWNRKAWWVGSWYFTHNILLAPGQTVTIRLESLTDVCPVFIDNIHMTSLDAFFASEIPSSGSAMGQAVVEGRSHESTIRGDGRWAATFGLQYMTYEHGWSAGGDAGDTPLQVQAKYYDPRAGEAQYKAIDIFQRAGGTHATFGTYATWPVFSEPNRTLGAADVDQWPLVQGMNRSASAPVAPIDNGASVPGALAGYQWSANRDRWKVKADQLASGQWLGYNFVIPRHDRYRIGVHLDGTGAAALSIGGRHPILTNGGAGWIIAEVDLDYGLHSVRVTGLTGTVDIRRVVMAPSNMSTAVFQAIRPKYVTQADALPVPQGQVWMREDFGEQAGLLHGHGTRQGLGTWQVQNQSTEAAGFHVAIDQPLSENGGAYGVGGWQYLSSGVVPDFTAVPSGYLRKIDDRIALGAAGTTMFTNFKIRRSVGASPELGWSKGAIAAAKRDDCALICIIDNQWALRLRDPNGGWHEASTGIEASADTVFTITLAVSFGEYGSNAELWIDGASAATLETEAEIACHQLVFSAGASPGGAMIDAIHVGDSLSAVTGNHH